MVLARYLDVFIDGLKKELADIDYVWVTTVASIGPEDPPVSPYRLVCNLINDANSDDISADSGDRLMSIASDAKKSAEYWDEWVTVAAAEQDSPVHTCDECGSRL